ncbi:hypothetical protein DSO57_1017517 [Entomophthora muscae]|uniref:Uncharacterized protein n=1 Tax=Entomophthora muscae TaxID=34485 RepID=A0ACC2T4K4_9FUNG|nr:hypothetical protein DSO57_1017517 [Entomophthora muscae]
MTRTPSLLCSQAHSLKFYTQRDIGIHAIGMVNGNVHMVLKKGSYCKTNGNFTKHFLLLAGSLIDFISPTFKRKSFVNMPFYYWEGGRPVTVPISCFENEQCTVNATWNGKGWISKVSKQ